MKDIFKSFYTNATYITAYMVSMLNIKENDKILEPSAGDGAFIDQILRFGVNVVIDALDLNEIAVSGLKLKYAELANISIRLTDTLLDEQLDFYVDQEIISSSKINSNIEQSFLFSKSLGYYDKVIGNPPYGAWQDFEKRALLKKKYNGHYVKETYSLFLLRCISLLKENGRLSFIIPDTFLFLNMHSKLRQVLLSKTKIVEILIFPSKLFPGVNYGYSNMSIITLEKCVENKALENTVRIIKGLKSANEFDNITKNIYNENLEIYNLKQIEIYLSENHRFILSNKLSALNFKDNHLLLEDVADIVTGLYTGDNLSYIRVAGKFVKGAKNYQEVEKGLIFENASILGLNHVDEGYIPFVKGSPTQSYINNDNLWYIRWDEKTVCMYKKNKKSRFQNSDFYFKTGIGIPMVKSKKIKAILMKNRVFDQSIVGIFPKKSERINYILALMNSDVVSRIINLLNPTANNSSNYIKKIPYLEPDSTELNRVVELTELILTKRHTMNVEFESKIQQELNSIFNKLYIDYLNNY